MKEIIDEAGLEAAISDSQGNPAFLFKHSTTCPISSAAYREVEGYVKTAGDARAVYLIKVIESRPVSNAIASRTGVGHKSPQVILVDGDQVVWDASHYGISREKMEQALGSEYRD